MQTREALLKRQRKEQKREEKVRHKREAERPPGDVVRAELGLRHKYGHLIIFLMVGIILGTILILNTF